MAKPKNKRQAKAPRRWKPPTTASLLSQIDPATLSPAGQALLAKAIAADRPITANAIPTLGQAVKSVIKPKPAAPVSPWVRRAQQGRLPQKDMTNSTGPRADTYGGIADVAKASPYLSQATGVELLRTIRQELHSMNRARVARGERPIDFPGNTGPGTRNTTKRKATKMPKNKKQAKTTGLTRASMVSGKDLTSKGKKKRTTTPLTQRKYSKGRTS